MSNEVYVQTMRRRTNERYTTYTLANHCSKSLYPEVLVFCTHVGSWSAHKSKGISFKKVSMSSAEAEVEVVESQEFNMGMTAELNA